MDNDTSLLFAGYTVPGALRRRIQTALPTTERDDWLVSQPTTLG
jgi:hypothetical protein